MENIQNQDPIVELSMEELEALNGGSQLFVKDFFPIGIPFPDLFRNRGILEIGQIANQLPGKTLGH